MAEESYMNSLTQHVLLTSILMGLIAIVGLVGNALMLRALFKYETKRTDFYTVFGALSIADSLFLVISVPVHITDMVAAEGVTTDVWCKASSYLMSTCGFIAAFLIVVLSVLRGILLTNRNTVRRPQARHLVVVCGVMYLLAFLSSIPIINVFASFGLYCDFVDREQARQETWLLNAFSSFIPLTLVFVIYLMTYLLGKRYFSDSYSLREKEKSRLVTSIIIAFSLCQLPYRIFGIYEVYVTEEDHEYFMKMYTIKNYLMFLVMADKAVRPVLYSKLASDLSESFDEVINCSHCHKNYSATPSLEGSQPIYVPNEPNQMSCAVIEEDPGNSGRGVLDRAISTSSSASTTSQTPLMRKHNDSMEML